eukprot:3691490-Amphidinium_carterae.1
MHVCKDVVLKEALKKECQFFDVALEQPSLRPKGINQRSLEKNSNMARNEPQGINFESEIVKES